MTCGGVVTFWIFLLFSLILLNVNLTNGGRPDELHIGGIFPIAGKGGWQGGQACMPAAKLALDDVNKEKNLLPGFKLILHSNDSEFSSMKEYPPAFYENFHMDSEIFEEIHARIEKFLLPKRQTRPIDYIPTRLRLALVLEYYANGTFHKHMASIYNISKSSFCIIIKQVSRVIALEFKDEFITLNKANWVEVSNEYNYRWQLPNCLGAFDGKHIAIKKPYGAGSDYFNYKRFHSIILMAVADAHYRFISIDVGAKGAEGDANVFSRTQLGQMIKQDSPFLNLPPDALLGNSYLPYYFIGDDAFPLMKRMIKPYSKNRRHNTITPEEVIFNYRLSRARRCVENAFGILVRKWACVGKTFHCSPETVKHITAACCLLHNFMIKKRANTYIPPQFKDLLDSDGEYIHGIWRAHGDNRSLPSVSFTALGRSYLAGIEGREVIKNFVNSPQGSLPFQRTATHLV